MREEPISPLTSTTDLKGSLLDVVEDEKGERSWGEVPSANVVVVVIGSCRW